MFSASGATHLKCGVAKSSMRSKEPLPSCSLLRRTQQSRLGKGGRVTTRLAQRTSRSVRAHAKGWLSSAYTQPTRAEHVPPILRPVLLDYEARRGVESRLGVRGLGELRGRFTLQNLFGVAVGSGLLRLLTAPYTGWSPAAAVPMSRFRRGRQRRGGRLRRFVAGHSGILNLSQNPLFASPRGLKSAVRGVSG